MRIMLLTFLYISLLSGFLLSVLWYFQRHFSITSFFCRNNIAVHICSSNSAHCSSANTSPGQNFQNTKCGWNPYGVIITPEMELADNTYLDGDGESVLKALERANPQTIEPRTIWQTSFLRVQELWGGGWWESLLGLPLIHKVVSRISV